MSTMITTKACLGGKAIAASAFLALALIGVSPAVAAPMTDATVTKVAEATSIQVQPIVAADGADDQSNCSRARRRLWVDGEGWIVRRVTTCR